MLASRQICSRLSPLANRAQISSVISSVYKLGRPTTTHLRFCKYRRGVLLGIVRHIGHISMPSRQENHKVHRQHFSLTVPGGGGWSQPTVVPNTLSELKCRQTIGASRNTD